MYTDISMYVCNVSQCKRNVNAYVHVNAKVTANVYVMS